MRERLALQAAREKHEGTPAAHYVARVGRDGHAGARLVLQDVRTADTDEPVTDHVWFPRTEEFAHVAAGNKIRFSAAAQAYMKAGQRDARGRRTARVMDYGFGRPSYVEKTAMSVYNCYLMWKQADEGQLPVPAEAAAAGATSAPVAPTPVADGGLDLRVLGGTMHQHMIAQTQGYMPIATLHGEGGSLTHIVYSHRKTWNAAQKLLHGDPGRFVVTAHGLVAPGGSTPGGRVEPVKYG